MARSRARYLRLTEPELDAVFKATARAGFATRGATDAAVLREFVLLGLAGRLAGGARERAVAAVAAGPLEVVTPIEVIP